jgi:putative addiction module killer protein
LNSIVISWLIEFAICGKVEKRVESNVYRSKEFKIWYKSLTSKDQRIIDSRIDTYKKDNELINAKILNKIFSLYEFKWNSGMRVYFSLLKDDRGNFMLLLLGGNKNSQEHDIVIAKSIIAKVVGIIRLKGKSDEKA